MPKFLRDKNTGKFLGSIGAGKNKTPLPAPTKFTPTSTPTAEQYPQNENKRRLYEKALHEGSALTLSRYPTAGSIIFRDAATGEAPIMLVPDQIYDITGEQLLWEYSKTNSDGFGYELWQKTDGLNHAPNNLGKLDPGTGREHIQYQIVLPHRTP